MAVVLYSGSLSGFFLGDWRQRLPAAELGAAAAGHGSDSAGYSPAGDDDSGEINDDDDDDDTNVASLDCGDSQADEEDASPADVEAYFQRFRDQLVSELRPHLKADLFWREGSESSVDSRVTPAATPSFTAAASDFAVLVPESAFAALMLIAARFAVANKRLSPMRPNKPWFEDPAVVQIQEAEHNYAPVHHLVQADSWLPADFNLILPTEVPDRDLILGSLPQLAEALAELQPVLHQPSEATRKLAAPFVAAAREAHAAFTAALAHAVANSSVMVVGTH